MLEHEAADQWANGHAAHEAGEPHRDGKAALSVVAKHVGDQRQDRRRQRRAGKAEQRAGNDEKLRRRREGREHGGKAERGAADHQQLPPADAVAQRAHGHEEAG
jgi:hypothetical protein